MKVNDNNIDDQGPARERRNIWKALLNMTTEENGNYNPDCSAAAAAAREPAGRGRSTACPASPPPNHPACRPSTSTVYRSFSYAE